MNTTANFKTDLNKLKLRKKMHKPVHTKTPLWLKSVVKSQRWFLEEKRLLER